jgi:hypothetical protein
MGKPVALLLYSELLIQTSVIWGVSFNTRNKIDGIIRNKNDS